MKTFLAGWLFGVFLLASLLFLYVFYLETKAPPPLIPHHIHEYHHRYDPMVRT